MPSGGRTPLFTLAYGRLLPHLAMYGSYHTDPINQWIHILFVPTLLLTAFVLLSSLPLPPVVGSALSAMSGGVAGLPRGADWSLAIAVAYGAFYLYLSPSPLGALAVLAVAGLLAAARAWVAAAGGRAAATPAAVALHVFGWLVQFYGHGVHERRAPALLDNLAQAIFMAPFFVLIELGFKLGLLVDLKEEVDPEIRKRVRAFRESGDGRVRGQTTR